MILSFATKRGANGLRKWLVMDTERKEFSRDCRRFCPSRDDFVEIGDKDRKKLLSEIEDRPGWREVDYVKEA